MRGTIHLVSARDACSLRPLVQPVLDRDLHSHPLHAASLRDLDLEALAGAGRELLEAEPRTLHELGASLAYPVRNLLPLVQLPPRGVWGRSGKPVVTTLEAWTCGSPEAAPSLETLENGRPPRGEAGRGRERRAGSGRAGRDRDRHAHDRALP